MKPLLRPSKIKLHVVSNNRVGSLHTLAFYNVQETSKLDFIWNWFPLVFLYSHLFCNLRQNLNEHLAASLGWVCSRLTIPADHTQLMSIRCPAQHNVTQKHPPVQTTHCALLQSSDDHHKLLGRLWTSFPPWGSRLRIRSSFQNVIIVNLCLALSFCF